MSLSSAIGDGYDTMRLRAPPVVRRPRNRGAPVVEAVEVERKFLVARRPAPADVGDGIEITQGYLAVEDEREVRLRRKGSRCLLTVKTGSGLVRSEHEVELGPEQFDRLWPATEGRRVEKTRFTIALGSLTAELDVYRGALGGLETVEVEFPNAAAATAFEPPTWFGRELTGDRRYANKRLAMTGCPQPD
jgi:CYTH domain-containing protein